MSLITPDARIGAVSLRVADLERGRRFYREAIGLVDEALVRLIGDPDAPPRPPGTTGLFHLALLVPTRRDLAHCLARVIDSGWRLTGASDHLVSEALYLNDPEGNGIEIYRDRPRAEWRRSESGELAMATLPLDMQSLIDELDEGGAGPEIAAGATIGHLHLNVANLAAAEDFYCGELGFEVMVRGYPGALFVAAGGYHHHIGLNTWNGPGAPAPPRGSLGLDHFEVVVPGIDEPRELTDPAGNRVHLV